MKRKIKCHFVGATRKLCNARFVKMTQGGLEDYNFFDHELEFVSKQLLHLAEIQVQLFSFGADVFFPCYSFIEVYTKVLHRVPIWGIISPFRVTGMHVSFLKMNVIWLHLS